MRTLPLMIIFLLSACVGHPQESPANRVAAFYSSYLEFMSGSDDRYDQLQEYISTDTLARLSNIGAIPEQEIIGSDYFTYVQDYDASWIKRLKIGHARALMGGKVIPVWLGIENGNVLHLEVYMRCENGKWKIYRVKDISHHYEQPIFNAGAIAQAKSAAQNNFSE